MEFNKEAPIILIYALVFFVILIVASYIYLATNSGSSNFNSSRANYRVPSYQNLFSASR